MTSHKILILSSLLLLACDPTLVPVNPPEPGDGAEQPAVLPPSPIVIIVSPQPAVSPSPITQFPFAITTAVQEALPSGLGYSIVRTGAAKSPRARDGQRVSVHYTGWLTNGQVFDSSRPRKKPFRFTLGAGTVIQGWEEGVTGMQTGEWRKLVIPPRLAYGENGTRSIPPRATLIFEVELLAVE